MNADQPKTPEPTVESLVPEPTSIEPVQDSRAIDEAEQTSVVEPVQDSAIEQPTAIEPVEPTNVVEEQTSEVEEPAQLASAVSSSNLAEIEAAQRVAQLQSQEQTLKLLMRTLQCQGLRSCSRVACGAQKTCYPLLLTIAGFRYRNNTRNHGD